MLIVYMNPGTGWQPITYMVSLAAELLEAELLILDNEVPNCLGKLESIFLRRQKRKSNESCLLICPNPTYLLSLLLIKDWRKRFRYIAAWIIDSFWLDWIPRITQLSQLFDHLFVTTEEDIPAWKRVMKVPTTWLILLANYEISAERSSEETAGLSAANRETRVHALGN